MSGYPFTNLFYYQRDSSCANVIEGYDITVLTGVAYAANNLQKKVREKGLIVSAMHLGGGLGVPMQ